MQSGAAPIIPKTWILLDSQSTIDLFCNEDLVENIRTAAQPMHVNCNAGVRVTKLIADLKGYGTVWFDPKAIANILSLDQFKAKKYRVQYDIGNEDGFVVTKPDGSSFAFQVSKDGLHYMDATLHKQGMVLVNTVEGIKNSYTVAHYNQAKLARDIQIRIGRPSTREFIKIVTSNLLKNCPVTKDDILAAEHVFGPDVESLKGKTTRQNPPRIDMSRMNACRHRS